MTVSQTTCGTLREEGRGSHEGMTVLQTLKTPLKKKALVNVGYLRRRHREKARERERETERERERKREAGRDR